MRVTGSSTRWLRTTSKPPIKVGPTPINKRLREFIAGVIASRKQKTNSNEKGHGWVDLEAKLGWPICAPAERPLQMLATVGLKRESDGRSGGPKASP